MNTVDGDDAPSTWERLVEAASDQDSEWPLVAALVTLLVAKRRLVARIYGYGVAGICLLEADMGDPRAPRGWPVGLAILAATAIATDHEGVRERYPRLQRRAGRLLAYGALLLVVLLGVLVLPPAYRCPRRATAPARAACYLEAARARGGPA